ncbi:MAG: TIGR03086 family metal-binding protein [Acidimicrobiia bacterium]
MSEISGRFRRVSGAFTETAQAVPADAWENPSPCEGWVARDVVRHLVTWVPAFLHAGAGVELPAGPPVDDDPVAAWAALRDALQGLLDDPDVAAGEFDHERAGRHRLDDAIAQFILGDVLIHTWDLARSAGVDVTLDPDEVRGMLAGVEQIGDALEKSGQYGRRVEVAPGADPQTKLLAATGRRP